MIKNLLEKIDNSDGYCWFCRLFYPIKYFFRHSIKYFFQRHVRGYDDSDTWNLYWYISRKLLPVLKRMREHHNGYPYNLTFEKWDTILEKIQIAFELIVKGEEDYIEEQDKAIYKKAIDEGLDLFREYFFNLWD